MTTRTLAASLSLQVDSGGLPDWAWLLIIIAIILLVWWLLIQATRETPDVEAHHAEHESAQLEPPPALKGSASVAPDDLAVLEGIGPKVKSVLAEAGITTFNQLAATPVEKLNSLLEGAGYQYMDPKTWPEQAKLLAEGKMNEFQKLAEALKGGRRV